MSDDYRDADPDPDGLADDDAGQTDDASIDDMFEGAPPIVPPSIADRLAEEPLLADFSAPDTGPDAGSGLAFDADDAADWDEGLDIDTGALADEAPPTKADAKRARKDAKRAEKDAKRAEKEAAAAAATDGDDLAPAEVAVVDDSKTPWWRRRAAILPVWLWAALGVAVLLWLLLQLVGGDADEVADQPRVVDGAAVVQTTVDGAAAGATAPVEPIVVTAPPAVATAPPAVATAPPAEGTAPPVATAPPAEGTAPPAEGTEPPAEGTEPPAEGTEPPAEGTEPPAETTPPSGELVPVTVTGDRGETLTIEPRIGPCQRGTECLVVGFSADGFPPSVDTYTCEWSSGLRYTFRFSGNSVETACASIDVPDAITIIVDGVRSATITYDG